MDIPCPAKQTEAISDLIGAFECENMHLKDPSKLPSPLSELHFEWRYLSPSWNAFGVEKHWEERDLTPVSILPYVLELWTDGSKILGSTDLWFSLSHLLRELRSLVPELTFDLDPVEMENRNVWQEWFGFLPQKMESQFHYFVCPHQLPRKKMAVKGACRT